MVIQGRHHLSASYISTLEAIEIGPVWNSRDNLIFKQICYGSVFQRVLFNDTKGQTRQSSRSFDYCYDIGNP